MMTVSRLQDYGPTPYMASQYSKVKMERGDKQVHSAHGYSAAAIPITTVSTANDNWRGKNDPAERRRIQNRLNQRAFRERQRAGESPKQYKPRSRSGSAAQLEDSDDDSDAESDSDKSESSEESSDDEEEVASASSRSQPRGTTRVHGGRSYDELGQLINRNFMSAAVANAQHLGIEVSALQSGAAVRTPRPSQRQVPATLTPVELQYQVSHDPIIDTIPHARLRFNILRGIAAGQVDAAALSRCLRASGALEELGGSSLRGGVVVWSYPEQVASWELSEPFLRKWAFLLTGCEDLLAATNAWRAKRGEKTFP